MVELVILLEELGYACSATPFLGTALAALMIEHAGSDAQKSEWLAKLASGEARGTVGEAGQLAPDAVGADVVVVIDDDASDARDRRRAGRRDGPHAYLCLPRRAAATRSPGDVEGALRRCEIAVAAGLVGVGQRALDMTLEYIKDRKQFGVPIGSFQAVSHKATQMLFDTEGARSATLFGAWAADCDTSQLALGAAMAKAAASAGGRTTTAAGIQLHGGIGFTWEADLHWLYKRAQMDAVFLGGAGTHRARVAELSAQRVSARA